MATVTRFQRSIVARAVRQGARRIPKFGNNIPGIAARPSPTSVAISGNIISWQAALNALSYNVYRATSLNGTWTLLANVAANVLTYTDTTGVTGTLYYYSVTGVFVTGESLKTNPVLTAPNYHATAPMISNVSPVAGSALAPTAPVTFNITDTGFAIQRYVIMVVQGALQEVAYDGTAFTQNYAQSSVIPITNGFHFGISRVGGWIAAPTLKIVAYDAYGNEV